MNLLLVALMSIGTVGLFADHGATDSLQWQGLPQALEDAARTRRPVLIYVHAPWCGPCRRMERDVFPQTTSLLGRFALARLDFDDHETQIELEGVARSPFAWAHHFGAGTTPSFVLLDTDGSVITRATGFVDVRGFSLLLAYVATGAYRHATFDDYAHRASQPP